MKLTIKITDKLCGGRFDEFRKLFPSAAPGTILTIDSSQIRSITFGKLETASLFTCLDFPHSPDFEFVEVAPETKPSLTLTETVEHLKGLIG